MIAFSIHRYNELSLLLELKECTVESSHACILFVERYCNKHFSTILTNRVPAYNSLLLTLSDSSNINLLENEIIQILKQMTSIPVLPLGEEKVIPICYDEQLGNDLVKMAGYLQIDRDTIIHYHLSVVYRVYLLGFLPGFPYLGFVPQAIAMPRKQEPVPAKRGAVGIAGQQTGIYPVDTPGGWHIVGHTPYIMFDINRKDPALLLAGQRVRFEAIDLETYYKIK